MIVGFVGLGHMGDPIARQLLRSGHDVRVHDLRRDVADGVLADGARWAATLGEVADGVDAVLLSLPGPTEVKAVVGSVGGLLDVCTPGTAIIDLSTGSPELVRSLAQRGHERGIPLLDAPVAGGPRGARRGTLTVMVGGPQEEFERFRPVFEAMASNVFHAGDVGNGCVAKLINNQLCFTNVLAMTEALVVGTKAGVDPMVLREIVSTSSGGSFVWNGGTTVILQDRLQPTFTTALAAKDLRLASELAAAQSVPVPMLEAALSLMELRRDSGYADEDMMATVHAVEEAADWKVTGTWHD